VLEALRPRVGLDVSASEQYAAVNVAIEALREKEALPVGTYRLVETDSFGRPCVESFTDDRPFRYASAALRRAGEINGPISVARDRYVKVVVMPYRLEQDRLNRASHP